MAKAIFLIMSYLLGVNMLAYWLFREDKLRAIERDSRIPETALLWVAAVGGFFGAKLGQRRFRHKTRKQPFKTLLNIIPALYILVFVIVLWP